MSNAVRHQSSEQINPVELDWYADNDTVKVTPRDQKRFDIQKDRAIEYLQLAKRAEEFGRQFDLLLDCVGKWINERVDQVETSYITLQGGALTLLVVRKSKEYDEQFVDDLADLELDVANDPDLSLVSMNTLALPGTSRESLMSFLDKRLVLSYHGKRS